MALIDNILAYWRLDNDGSGGVSLVDSTPNSKTLTNNGSVALGPGKINGCGIFNGIDQSLSTATVNLNNLPQVSMQAWVKTEDTDTDTHFFGSWSTENGNQILFYNPTEAIFYTNEVGVSSFTPINDGNWHHLVGVYDAIEGTQTFYIDGINVGSAPVSSNLISTTVPFFGIGDSGQGTYLNGSIDECAIWTRALTSTEVTQLYNSGNGLSYPFGLFYFNAAVNGNLATLGNWWLDSGFTIPADALPDNSSQVFIAAPVTGGTATYYSATITANIGSAVSITANAITLNSGINSGTLIGPVVLNNSSSNAGTITGNATLNNSSSNAGTITGNATIYNPSANPIGGVVTGSETYLWPNGTGLWGGDVWINGDIAFIIPEPSDVRSGVEYGPASDPYVGTFSGGGGAATFRQTLLPRLLKLPFPIKI
jgi:hypothetical protein